MIASRLRRLSFSLWLPLALIAALRLPVVATPFLEDDLHQLSYLAAAAAPIDGSAAASPGDDGHPFAFRGRWDLFRFLDGDETATTTRMERGVLPWRTDPSQRAAFLRPVASLLMWLDHAVFGVASLPAHLHSLLWFVVFVLSVRKLYGVLLEPRAATIAVLACAVSSASLQTIKWWSARNALVAAFFAVWCLLHYLGWCRSGRPSRLVAAGAFLLLSLLSAESGIALLAFPLACWVTGGTGIRSRAATGTIGLFLVAAGWVAGRWALGYGVAGNALYVDPFAEPLAYLTTALPRLHRVLAVVFLNHATEIVWLVVPLLALLAAAVLPLPTGRGDGAEPARRPAVWLGVGSLLALTVSLASRSSLRPWTLMVPQLGAHALLGLLVVRYWSPRRGAPDARPSWGRWATAVLAAVVLVAPLYRHWTAAVDSHAKRHRLSAEARAGQFPPDVRRALTPETRRVVFLTSPYQVRTREELSIWHDLDLAAGVAVVTLTDNPFPGAGYRLERTAASRFRLRSSAALLRRNDFYRFDARRPLAQGATFTGEGFRVVVESTVADAAAGAGVTALLVELDLDLDDPRLVLLDWADGRFHLVEPPAPGDELARHM